MSYLELRLKEHTSSKDLQLNLFVHLLAKERQKGRVEDPWNLIIYLTNAEFRSGVSETGETPQLLSCESVWISYIVFLKHQKIHTSVFNRKRWYKNKTAKYLWVQEINLKANQLV